MQTNAFPAANAGSVIPAPSSGPAVVVIGFKGQPTVLKGNRWYSLVLGEHIAPGASVRTGSSDSLDLMLDEPGRIVSFGPSSSLSIDLTHSSVSLDAGEMVASIRKTGKGNVSIVVHSRFGVATVRAADFRVMLNPVPVIAVLDGVIDFEVARAQDTAPALQLRDDAVVIAGPDNPSIHIMDPQTRGFITGRVDALVSSQGALADKFWPRPSYGACHTPTLAPLIDPELRPGRIRGFAAIEEYRRGAYAIANAQDLIEYPPGNPACPIHNQRVHIKAKNGVEAPLKKKPWEEE